MTGLWVFTVVAIIVVALGVLIGTLVGPDIARYLRIRRM